jgi:hypothetical protein
LSSNCRSRFYDEDGDLAHEFFEEKDINGHTVMKQHWRNLRPEVNVFVNDLQKLLGQVANYCTYSSGRFNPFQNHYQ